MAALVLVLMVPVCVGVLVGVSPGLVGVLRPVMAVGTTFVAMLVLMLVLVVAAHLILASFLITYIIIINISPFVVNGFAAMTMGLDDLLVKPGSTGGSPAAGEASPGCRPTEAPRRS